MNISDFEYIARLLKERSGLVLSKDKAYLLESRLNPVARKWEFKGFDELAAAVRTARNEALVRDITEAMTTNESFFFRDTKPFDQFRDVVLPQLLETRKGARTIRIWSAACSSGQEPYSLAMILKESEAKLQGLRFEIIATDLSNEILAKAKEGLYSQFEVQRGLPINLLVKYFKQDGDRWRISDTIRQMVKYETFNLLESPSRFGKFDVVFCRNVLIYFDQPTKSKILDGIAGVLPPDGFLYLGGAETVLGLTERFHLVPGQRGLYGPAPAAGATAAVKAAG
jgi:chemotaxis protein methyltransferase CheR